MLRWVELSQPMGPVSKMLSYIWRRSWALSQGKSMEHMMGATPLNEVKEKMKLAREQLRNALDLTEQLLVMPIWEDDPETWLKFGDEPDEERRMRVLDAAEEALEFFA